jgi:FkbM family methyltransferase
MRALRNIARELAYQFKLEGSLIPRLLCVSLYYAAYGAARLFGADRDAARRTALARIARLGFSSRAAHVRAADGTMLELDVYAACYLTKEVLEDRTYEEFPPYRPLPGWTVLDVGAHQGVFTVRAGRLVGPNGKVISIEVFPGNAARLRRNVESNHLKNVTVVESAAGGKDGTATLHVSPFVSGGQSLVYDQGGATSMDVKMRTVDGILKELNVERVDLVKIDVEGAAQQVLDGAPRLLAAKPRLVMEVEGGEAEMGAMRARLQGLGYSVLESGSLLFAETPVAVPRA